MNKFSTALKAEIDSVNAAKARFEAFKQVCLKKLEPIAKELNAGGLQCSIQGEQLPYINLSTISWQIRVNSTENNAHKWEYMEHRQDCFDLSHVGHSLVSWVNEEQLYSIIARHVAQFKNIK